MEDFLTSMKGINKTDALSLITQFKTLRGILEAPREQLLQCPGFGTTKVNQLMKHFDENFSGK